MFIELLSAKNEKLSVNVDKVLFFGESKKGTTVILDDGTIIELTESYSDVSARINKRVQ